MISDLSPILVSETNKLNLEAQLAGDELALIFIGGVNYYSGQVFDLKEITSRGHKVGALVGFDLAHTVGKIFLQLQDWKVDFATWCSYKY